MRPLAVLFLLAATALAAPCPLVAQDLEAVRKQLLANYKGKVLTLRYPNAREKLRYDAEGKLKDKAEPGPWTLYALVQITDISLKHELLGMRGYRVYARCFDGVGFRYYETQHSFSAEIELATDSSPAQAVLAAIKRVFAKKREELADTVPGYWTAILKGEQEGCKLKAKQEPRPLSYWMEALMLLHSGKAGVKEAKLVHKVAPSYPLVAKMQRMEGQVSLEALIGEDGKLKNLRLVEIAGMGLDDAAAEAVSQWRYEPTLLNGEPVEVITIIDVVFRLR